ncbi:UNVERIFIED_CONTAM: hypothetical protein Scaly_1674400 [Sesamum calycinum]|uniref:Uncharacterized protein n=1 Tax=Sesamum calycinum TaxID=2727403 RepID=A0AAW2NVF6_9LAMI
MESALLCASSPLFSSQCHSKACGLGRNFRSSFTGKLLYKNSILIRNTGTASRSRAIVSSLLGRKVKKETIIPDPDYRIPIVLLGAAGGFVYVDNLAAAVPVALLGLLLLVQEVKVGDQLQESGENVFVGGKNRWKDAGPVYFWKAERQKI